MTEIKKVYDQRLVDAQAKTTPELHPRNRNEEIKIKGVLTSQIQSRSEGTSEPYYYAFVRLKEQSIDLPVIFKVKENDKLIKPPLKKSDLTELTGHYSNSEKSVRKSFTCSAYQLLSKNA